MNTEVRADTALVRLLQLVSPSLPVGGYSYSQGIEWAVEAGWIRQESDLGEWLEGLLCNTLCYLDLPILKRMLEAWAREDLSRLEQLNEWLVASRETRELRLEETHRARAFVDLLRALEPESARYAEILLQNPLACFSYACDRWRIGYRLAAQGLLMSWLENQVLAGVKIIPLGQTAGQRLIFELGARFPEIVALADALEDRDVGASSMAMAIASANHETQYTRLFRS